MIRNSLLTLAFLWGALFTLPVLAQKDSSATDMSFDLGISRGRGINLWPVLKVTRGRDRKEAEVLLKLFHYKKDAVSALKHTHLFPLYWYDSTASQLSWRILSTYYPSLVSYSKDRDKDIRSFKIGELAPEINLLELTRSKDGLLVQNNAFFFIWYKNAIQQQKSYLVAFPVYWQYKSRNSHSSTVFPLYSAGLRSSGERYLAVTPLFWRVFKDSSYSNTLFPIWWNRKSGTGEYTRYSNTLFPLYFANRDKYRNNKIIFPLVWSLKNTRLRSSSFTVAPLLSAGKTWKGQKYLALTPLYWRFSDSTHSSNTLFPVWWNKKTPWESYNYLLPLYYHYRRGTTTNTVLFPLAWSLKNSSYRSFTLFPVYSAGHSPGGEKHLAITPLFWRFSSSKGYSNTLFPIWWNKKTGNGDSAVYSNTLFPIYWSYKDKYKNRKVIFPLAWSLRDTSYASFTLIPLLSTGKAKNGNKHLAITPLFWRFSSSKGYSNTLFPIWWNKKTGNGDSAVYSNTLFPIYWSYKDKYKNRKIIFPLAWSLRDTSYASFTLIPLLSTGKAKNGDRHLAITPIFWRFSSNKGYSNTLFPIWWNRKSGNGGSAVYSNTLFPIYWSYRDKNKNRKVIFPLAWSLRDTSYASFTLIPLFSTGKAKNGDRHLAITPLFWRFSSNKGYSNTLFPIWWNRKTGNGDSAVYSNTLFPIYWSYKDKNKNRKIIFPLAWSLRDTSYASFTLIPLLSTGKAKNGDRHLAITPLFWRFSSNKGYSNTLFPIWWNKKTGNGDSAVHSNTIVPVYWSQRDRHVHNTVIFPLVWKLKDQNSRSFTLLPVFSQGRSRDGSRYLAVTPLFWKFRDSSNTHSSTALLPLWWHKRTGSGKERTDTTAVFPLYWSFKTRTGSNSVLFPFVYSSRKPEYSSFTVAPLFSYGKSAGGKRSHLGITPLFWRTRNDRTTWNVLFPVWWNRVHKSVYDTTKIHYILPVFWSYRDRSRSNTIVFPLAWRLKNPRHSSFTLFPVFSAGRSSDNLTRHLTLTPLFWNVRTPERHTVRLWPVFNYKSHQGTQKLNLLYVLLRWNKSHPRTTLSFLWPLMQVEKTDTSRYFRFAPLLWYSHSPHRQYFSLQPAYYHRKTQHTEVYKFFWQLYTYRSTKESVSGSILWKGLESVRYTDGGKEFRILHRLFVNVDRKDRKEDGIFPFYHFTSESSGAKSRSFLMSFYNFNRHKVPNTSHFYQEERVFWILRTRSNYRLLKEKGIVSSRRDLR
jgi:hypothetical protein